MDYSVVSGLFLQVHPCMLQPSKLRHLYIQKTNFVSYGLQTNSRNFGAQAEVSILDIHTIFLFYQYVDRCMVE